MDQDKLITAASYRLMVRLSFVGDGRHCILARSGGKLCVIGLLDNGGSLLSGLNLWRSYMQNHEPNE